MAARTYQRHTNQCGGPDWVVVQRIINAGTIDIINPDHLICDCERAAVIATGIPMVAEVLHCNGITIKKLQTLWASIEGTTDALVRDTCRRAQQRWQEHNT